jgi:hypothetical protein
MFEKPPLDLTTVPRKYVDRWMTSNGHGRGTWDLARETFPVRIEIPFSLTAQELKSVQVTQRWDACVAGAHYATRRIAQREIAAAGLSIAPYKLVNRSVVAATRVLSWITPAATASVAAIRLQQASQEFMVRRSRVNFVCGSGLGYPVRKFFEVPAAGSAMIAYPCSGFADYGFIDGENAIVAAPEDAGTVARRIVRDEKMRSGLTRRASEVMQTLHSVDRRAKDFLECLRRFDRGQLKNAQFVDGRFEID